MSKTYSRIYSRDYRAGRKLRWWEKLMIFFRGTRGNVETWLTDEPDDGDFYALLFAGVCLALAGIAVWAATCA